MFKSVRGLLFGILVSGSTVFAQTTCTPASSCLNPPPLPVAPFAGYPQIPPIAPLADVCNSTYPDFVITKAAGSAGVQSFAADSMNTWMNYIYVPDPGGTCHDTRVNRFTWYDRSAARAAVFLSLLLALQQSPASLTAEQAAMVSLVAQELQVRMQDAALFAQYEYNAWIANPCTFNAPSGFAIYNPGSGSCVTGDKGPVLASGAMPPLPPFAAYGAGTAFMLLNSAQGANAARETVSLLAPTLQLVYRGTGFSSYKTFSPYSLDMEGALSAMGSSHAFGVNSLGQMLAPAMVVTAALGNSLLNGVANASAAQLPGALTAAISASNSPPQLQTLIFPPGGSVNTFALQELFGVFLELTLLDGPDPQLFVPAPSASAPLLQISSSSGATIASSVVATVRNPVYPQLSAATISLNKNWFAISTDGHTAQLNYLLGYLDWNGTIEQARIVNGSFYTADAGNNTSHLSPALYMRDAQQRTLRVTLVGASLPTVTGASQFFNITPASGPAYVDSTFVFPNWSQKLSTMQFDGASLVLTPFFGNSQTKSTQFQYIAWDGSFWTATVNPTTKLFFLSKQNSLTGTIGNSVKLKGFDGGNWTFQLK